MHQSGSSFMTRLWHILFILRIWPKKVKHAGSLGAATSPQKMGYTSTETPRDAFLPHFITTVNFEACWQQQIIILHHFRDQLIDGDTCYLWSLTSSRCLRQKKESIRKAESYHADSICRSALEDHLRLQVSSLVHPISCILCQPMQPGYVVCNWHSSHNQAKKAWN